MARIKNKILGNISGTLGDLSLRNRKGVNYIAMRPVNYKVPTDEASVIRRKKFSTSVKFASAINSNPILASLWSYFKPDNVTNTNFIMQYNYKLMDNGELSNLNTAVPYGGFPVSVKSFTNDESQLALVINPLEGAINFNTEIETKVILSSVIYLSGALPGAPSDFYFLKLPNIEKEFQTIAEETFTIPLTGLENDFISKYENMKIFSALTTYDVNKNLINYSQSINN